MRLEDVMKEFTCPKCSSSITGEKFALCSECNTAFRVDADAEFVDGIWRDLTTLSEVIDVEIGGIDGKDHPDYCDAYIEKAYVGETELTDSELEQLGELPGYVHNKVIEFIH